MINCQYCKLFLQSKIINSEDKIRQCIATNKKINALSEICEVFEPAEYFYCFERSQRINIRVCVNSQNSKIHYYDRCKKCSQGNLIRSINELLPKKFKIKRLNIPNKIYKIKRISGL